MLPEFASTMDRFRNSMLTYVQALADAGEFRGDVETLAKAFFTAAHGIVTVHMSGLLVQSVEERNELHRATMRLLARGAGMTDVAPLEGVKPVSPREKRSGRNGDSKS